MEKQRTISKAVSFSGIGLHTGNPSTITFKPAPANYGYKFIRTDIDQRIEIPALVDYVVDLSRGTTLGIGDVRVHTVEHVLAALAGLRIDNCIIELSANEPPVVDGSSLPYVEALKTAGIVEQDAERKYLIIDETIRYTNEAKHVDIVALPTDDYRITVMVDYFNPALGSQHTGLFNLEQEFETEFAPARTFCFLTEVEMLYKNGLIKGGSLDSAIVIIDCELSDEKIQWVKETFKLKEVPHIGENGGILNNTKLRFKNEPARHKLLDMIGDLTLVGAPIKAQILAARPGHASNFEFTKLLRKKYLKQLELERLNPNKATDVVLDINGLLKIMPHRYPFLLIDRIISFSEDGKKIVGYKNITFNEPFFLGHFPERPVMPGVLICEALAQTGGLIVWSHFTPEELGKKLLFFTGMKNVRFKKPVIPGDQLVMEVELLNRKMNILMFKGVAYVDGVPVAEAEFQASIVDR
jgi:UDP-3-O-[3-hydroxymyristoyl] N-acetylglucosamine deacetylase/3-hydroxyacyl-[acyl-carrier-protein] dehydratase